MDRLLIYFGRLILITLGFIAAALAASAAMHLLVLPALGFDHQAVPALSGAALVSVPLVALFVGSFTCLPALAGIAIAELWSLRSWLFYALAGGLVGLIWVLIFRATARGDALDAGYQINVLPPGSSIYNTNVLLIVVAAGMVGGIAYWLVAGRSAGAWRAAAAERFGRR